MSRRENLALIHDLIAQAAVEQDEGRETYSNKLTALMERALEAMGTPVPKQHRFGLEGLEDLIKEIGGGQDESWRQLPIVVRMPDGQVTAWMTVETEKVSERGARGGYRAVVLTPVSNPK